jgi:hypothetical protein
MLTCIPVVGLGALTVCFAKVPDTCTALRLVKCGEDGGGLESQMLDRLPLVDQLLE